MADPTSNEGRASVRQLAGVFNKRESSAPVPKAAEKKSQLHVDWLTKGNLASPAKKPIPPRQPQPQSQPPLAPSDQVAGQLRKMEEQLELTKREYRELRQKQAEQQKEFSKLENERLGLEMSRSKVVAQLEVVRRETDAKIRSLQEALANAEIKEKQAVSNAEALKAAHVDALSSAQMAHENSVKEMLVSKGVNERISSLQMEVTALEREKTMLATDMGLAINRGNELERELLTAKTELAERLQEVSAEKVKVKELGEKLKAARKAADAAEREVQDLKTAVTKAEAERDNAFASKEVCLAETRTARHEAEAARKAAASVVEELQKARDEADEASATLEELKREIATIKSSASVAAAAAALAATTSAAEIEKARGELSAAKLYALTAESRIQAMQKQVEAATAAEAFFKAQAADAAAEAKRREEACMLLEQEVEKMQEEVVAAQEKAAEAEELAERKGNAATAMISAAKLAEIESLKKSEAAMEEVLEVRKAEEVAKRALGEARAEELKQREATEAAMAELAKVKAELEAAKLQTATAESRYEAARREGEAAKAAELMALSQVAVKAVKEGEVVVQQEEMEDLQRRLREMEELGEKRAMAAMAQLEAAKAVEQERQQSATAAMAETLAARLAEATARKEAERLDVQIAEKDRVGAEIAMELALVKKELAAAMAASATLARRHDNEEEAAMAELEKMKREREEREESFRNMEQEMEGLKCKLAEAEELAEKRVVAAMAQTEAAKASEQHSLQKLEIALREVRAAKEEAAMATIAVERAEKRVGEVRSELEKKVADFENAEGLTLAAADLRNEQMAVEGGEVDLNGERGEEGEEERERAVALEKVTIMAAAAKAAEAEAKAKLNAMEVEVQELKDKLKAAVDEAEKLRAELKDAEAALAAAESRYVAALAETEVAKVGEKVALRQAAAGGGAGNAAAWKRSTTFGGFNSSVSAKISADSPMEVETLRRQLKEMQELAGMRVEAAQAEVAAAKAAEQESLKKAEAAMAELAAAQEAEVRAKSLEEREREQEESMGRRAEIAASEIAMAKAEAKAAKRAEADALWQLNALLGTKEVLEGELKKWREEAVVRRRTAEAVAARQDDVDRSLRFRLAAESMRSYSADMSFPSSLPNSGPLVYGGEYRFGGSQSFKMRPSNPTSPKLSPKMSPAVAKSSPERIDLDYPPVFPGMELELDPALLSGVERERRRERKREKGKEAAAAAAAVAAAVKRRKERKQEGEDEELMGPIAKDMPKCGCVIQ